MKKPITVSWPTMIVAGVLVLTAINIHSAITKADTVSVPAQFKAASNTPVIINVNDQGTKVIVYMADISSDPFEKGQLIHSVPISIKNNPHMNDLDTHAFILGCEKGHGRLYLRGKGHGKLYIHDGLPKAAEVPHDWVKGSPYIFSLVATTVCSKVS